MINCLWLVLYKVSKEELRLLIKPAAGDQSRELMYWQTKYLGFQKTPSRIFTGHVSVISLGLFSKVKAFLYVCQKLLKRHKSCLKILTTIQ